MLSLQREEEAGSEAINLLYAGHPGRVVDVVLQVAVAVGDDVVEAGEHQPGPVETISRQYITLLLLVVITRGGYSNKKSLSFLAPRRAKIENGAPRNPLKEANNIQKKKAIPHSPLLIFFPLTGIS